MRRIKKFTLPRILQTPLAALQKKWNEAKFRTKNPGWREDAWIAYRPFLVAIQAGFCAYCESDAAAPRNGEVEHFFHKQDYHQYKFRWSNWLLSCFWCNKAKGVLDLKKDPWVDPRKHDPAEYLSLLKTGKLVERRGIAGPESAMAVNTIVGADLNCTRTQRDDILKERRQAAARRLYRVLAQLEKAMKSRSREWKEAAFEAVIDELCDRDSPNLGAKFIVCRDLVANGVLPMTVYTRAMRRYLREGPTDADVFP